MQDIASKIRALDVRINEMGEARLREAKKHYDAIQELIAEYSKKPNNYFTRVELVKKLNRIAVKVQKEYAAGTIKEEVKAFDRALLAIKKFKFKAAGEALEELRPITGIVEERALLLQEYKKGYLSLQSRRLDWLANIAEIEAKLALFRGEACGDEEYAIINARIGVYNAFTSALLCDFIAKAEARKAVAIMLDVYSNPELALPAPPKEADALRQFLAENEIGKSTISQLLELSRYSQSKLQHYLKNAKAFLEVAEPNLPWLESLESLKFAAALQADLDNSLEDLRIRIPKLITAISTMAKLLSIDCEQQISFLRELRRSILKGSFDRVRARHLQKKEKFDVNIQEEKIRILKEELGAMEKLLETLPDPATL